jgi:ribosomal protein L37E
MPGLTQEQKDKIVAKLEERGAKLPCPRCGSRSFTLLDGYFTQPVCAEIGAIVLGGTTVPSIVVVCTQCGFLSQHALGALGMLPATEKENNK